MERLVVVGGSSGIGRAIAQQAVARGLEVIIAARNRTQLARVAQELGAHATVIDLTSESSVRSGFEAFGPIDHLVVSGSRVETGSLREQPVAAAKASFE